MASERVSFFLGAVSCYPLQSFLRQKSLKKGFLLLSGLGISGIKRSEHDFSFQKTCMRNFNIFTDYYLWIVTYKIANYEIL